MPREDGGRVAFKAFYKTNMGGDTARFGFSFQDQYLLLRMLGEIAARTDALGTASILFGIESRTVPADDIERPPWDVVIRNGASVEVIEVKSGAVSREDRHVFWARLRSEAANRNMHGIVPKLVCDPDKIGNVDPWRGLAKAAAKSTESKIPIMPGRVATSEDLLEEALFCVCGPADSETDLPMSIGTADEVLDVLEVVKRWWEHLAPLAYAVMEKGSKPDCFFLSFEMDGGDMIPFIGIEDVLKLSETLVERLVVLIREENINLEGRAPEMEDYNTWKDVLGHLASAVGALHSQGLFRNDHDRERSERVLRKMSDSPFGIPGAKRALNRLTNEDF